MSCLYSWSWL